MVNLQTISPDDGKYGDASKDNPIDWENIAGKTAVVESGMRVLYELIHSDLQRDLRGSVQARYQPHGMIAEVYESFTRALRALSTLSVNQDRVAENLQSVRDFPSEAMVAIMRGDGYAHPQHGISHDTVKVFSRLAKQQRRPLLQVALEDDHFADYFSRLSESKRKILEGQLELYVGSAAERVTINKNYARKILRGTVQ